MTIFFLFELQGQSKRRVEAFPAAARGVEPGDPRGQFLRPCWGAMGSGKDDAGCGISPGWSRRRAGRALRFDGQGHGRCAGRPEGRRGIGLSVPALRAVPPHDGVRKTIASGLRVRPAATTRPRAEIGGGAWWLLEKRVAAWRPRRDAIPAQLSGGQRQSVALGPAWRFQPRHPWAAGRGRFGALEPRCPRGDAAGVCAGAARTWASTQTVIFVT